MIWLWGWPGAGKRLLLRELAATDLLEVAPADLLESRGLAAAAAEARRSGHRWLGCRKPPHAIAPEIFDQLRLDLPLLLAVDELPEGVEGDVLGPGAWLLTAGEVAGLWLAVTGNSLEPADAEAWREATSGWYRPLRLAAEAEAEGVHVTAEPLAVTSLPAVAGFLRDLALEPRLEPSADAVRPALAHSRRKPGPELAGFELPATDPDLPPAPLLLTLAEPSPALYPRRGEQVPVFSVQLFGPPRVVRSEPAEGSGGEEISWSLQRSFGLFAFLASAPERRASKEELVEALFPNQDEARIRANFHPTLSHLRRDLGGGQGSELRPVLFRGGSYQLDPGLEWHVDLERFEGHLAAAAERRRAGDARALVEHLKAAWGLYRGPYLQGLYDPWVVQRREGLHRGYLGLLRELGTLSFELGDLATSLDAYRAVLVEDPLEETVQTAILRIYAAQGRRDLVRRQYDRLCRLLLEELGVEPLPETTAEYHRLMA